MSLCVSQAVEAADFMMHHQPHKQQCGRDREGEKDMGGVEEARQSDKYKEVLRREVMNGWINPDKGQYPKICCIDLHADAYEESSCAPKGT